MDREAFINTRNRLVTHGDQFDQCYWLGSKHDHPECGCLLSHALLANGWSPQLVSDLGSNLAPVIMTGQYSYITGTRIEAAANVLGINEDEAAELYWGGFSTAEGMDCITAEDAIRWLDAKLDEDEPEDA